MQLLTLTAILLKDKPATQTREFYDRTTMWLSQWTATNNYGPVLIDVSQDTALRIWKDKFLSQFRSAMCNLVEPSDGLVNHFTFRYHITELNLNQEGSAIGSCSFELCDIDDGSTELTDFGKECKAYASKLCIRLDWLDDLHLVAMRPGSLFTLFEEDEDDEDTRGYINISTQYGNLNELHKELYQEIESLVGEEVHGVLMLGTKAVRVSVSALRILGVPLPESLVQK